MPPAVSRAAAAVAARGTGTGGNVPAPAAHSGGAGAVLHYGDAMADEPTTSRAVAITLIVLTALAFIGILAGLAMGRIDVAGMAGLVLVLLWFGVLGFRGRR